MARGCFITLEGGEGTGKSTQIELLAAALVERGFEVVTTREPGGTALAEAIRSLLLDPEFAPDGLVEVFLYEAARRDHVEKLLRPALERGAVVLCDRFADSSLVYQGLARGVGWDEVERLNSLATGALEPRLTLVLDMDAGAAVERARDRNSASPLRESRFDDEPGSFHRLVRDGYRELARRSPDRVRLIDASEDAQRLHRLILEIVLAELA